MKPVRPGLHTTQVIFAAILLVHLLFFLSALINPPVSLTDSTDYLNASQNLYKQGVLYCGDLSAPIVEEQFTRRPPLYPLLLGITGPARSNIPAFLVQILMSMISLFLVYTIFFRNQADPDIQKELHKRNRAMLFATLLLLATPAQFIYANRIMAEVPFQLILVLLTWSVYSYFNKGKDRYIWMFNIFLTLGMATKPVLFPFAILIVVASEILFLKTKRSAFVWAIILPILWIGLYSIWNYNRTGSAQYSSIQTANMVNYNLRYFLTGEEGKEKAAAEVDRLYMVCGEKTAYREKNNCLDKGVRELILERPVKYGIFHLKGSVRYFIDPGRFDLVTFFNLSTTGSEGFLHELNQNGLPGAYRVLKAQGLGLIFVLGLIVLFKLVKILGFILYIVRGKQQLPFRIFLLVLVGYLALVTGPLGASRFLLPVELLLLGGAVLGWISLLKKPGTISTSVSEV